MSRRRSDKGSNRGHGGMGPFNLATLGRRMMMKFAIVIVLALTMPASAEDMNDANSILPGCKRTLGTQMWEQGRCAGFVEGLRYGVGGRDFCPPNGVTTVQSV